MMRALRFHAYDGLAGLRLEDVPRPVPAFGEILVRVLAAGVNPFDWYAAEGWVDEYVTFTLPAIVGRDFSGIVEAIGAGVAGFRAGDAVYGHVDAACDGSFADYVAVPQARAALKPAVISHVEAASLPNVLMAAWNGLFSAENGADLRDGETILIHGAAGGIGSIAVQLARQRGARVIGTGSAGNLDFIRSLGVESVDYTRPGWMAALPAIAAVLDTSSGADADALCDRLKSGGRYIALRGLPAAPWAERQSAAGVRCAVASGPASEADFPAMTRVVADGLVKPIVTGVFPLEQARIALEQVSGGHVRGKLVLDMTAAMVAA